MSEPFPASGRLAGIDYGTVRIGVAITDPAQSIASPLENYSRRTESLDAQWFRKLAHQECIAGFVVGLPVHHSGQESGKSREARAFGAWLARVTNRPLCFYDERYSSALAEDMLGQAGLTKKRRKERLDKLAAQLILAAYLEAKTSGSLGEQLQPLDDRTL
jgi:putative Holliday junction resolvase